ncbi:MAG: ABC transporter ATP-binding protein [Bacteroidales bacterium]|nr:ABC transporter ATP-binding protein [Bacteroidales bacterium]MDD2204421.1 ABC transporter ATP-binding protein [Bacteroidales bacterium]MDD3152531.1 ABC transporter ATP-binding protein [Bacteroidales bacterium]
MEREVVIEVKNLYKKFGNFVANDNLSFKVYKGEIYGFLGANGAGKTTAMKILCGISLPTSGEVTIAHLDFNKYREKIKLKIGYMSQKFSLYDDLTVKENFRFFGGIYRMSRAQIKEATVRLLESLDMMSLMDTIVGSLPVGWKQKLAFTIANMHSPEIVFLDEPTGGVDPLTRRRFWELIYQAANNGVTVFVTTHYMDEAEYCNRLCIMNDGKIIVENSPKELKTIYNASNMDEVFLKIVNRKHS